MKKTLFFLSLMTLCIMTSCAQKEPYFRAAWISTVANIDWPSKAAIGDCELQKQEMIAMLDSFEAMHLNAVVFQVRPTADALYPSELEPWSHWLTGKQGVAATYDPLEFVCTEAHKRGIDVHVWINPYRVTIPAMNIDSLAPNHMYHKHPEWFVKYGKQWYYNPALQETRDFLCQVVADLVTRYDIQAIHMDDYFYPYPTPGVDFPDDLAFAAYGRGFANKGDWRRDNVNVLIKEIHETVRECKPWVKFGVSPFGIYRNQKSDPNGSATNGLQNYDDLYADVLMWVNNGWVDYNIPQLYWEIGHKAADYDTLIRWWAKHSSARPLFIGQDIHRTVKYADPQNNLQHQLPAKMKLQRSLPTVQGSCQWYSAAILENPGNYSTLLEKDYHRYPALIPTSPFIDDKAPDKVKKLKMVWTADGPVLFWTAPKAKTELDKAIQYVVYRFEKNEKVNLNDASKIVSITRDTFIRLPYENGKVKYQYVVTALDRLHNESKAVKTKVKL